MTANQQVGPTAEQRRFARCWIPSSLRSSAAALVSRRFPAANKGTDTRTIQAYLGHRNIQHTVCYTEHGVGARALQGPVL